MKVVTDRRIPGLEEGIANDADLSRSISETVALEGSAIKAADIADADAIIVRTRTRCDASLLQGSSVKLMGTATIGTDHIDIPWCEANGIRVVSAPGCNAPAVMQYVASALDIAGFDPASQTLGVVGKGNIGSLVTELYRRAGCNVLVCDPPRKDAGLADEDYLCLEELLSASDAVTFHVPYTRTGLYPTHSLLSGDLPSKPSIIVNASRGPVIDPNVILKEGLIRKFIIDTWPFEDFPGKYSDEDIISLVNMAFIATPHIAGYSTEGKGRATRAMLEALKGNFTPGYLEEVKSKAIIPLSTVIDSFSPLKLSENLKKNPFDFENMRSSHLRPEP